MHRRTTRLLAPLAAVGLLAALSACGDSKTDDAKASDSANPSASTSTSASAAAMTDGTIDGITVKGDVGTKPTVTWGDSGVTATDPVRQVLVTGDGATVEAKQKVFVQIWVGNGTTKKESYTSYDQAPQVVPVDPTQTLSILTDAIEGQKIGSRVLVAQSAAGAFGDPTGNTGLGLGKDDTAVFVIDILSSLLSAPEGATKQPAAWAPSVTTASDIPTALDFTGTPEPSGKFQITTLVEGKGAPLTKGQTAYVNYLGQVYNGAKPFDQSYTTGQPFSFAVGGGQVIKGWDQGLEGVTVGSRVILQIPPSWGYGSAGQSGAGIKGTDTLYFVVDVLGAA